MPGYLTYPGKGYPWRLKMRTQIGDKVPEKTPDVSQEEAIFWFIDQKLSVIAPYFFAFAILYFVIHLVNSLIAVR